jgi:hypothetical protein
MFIMFLKRAALRLQVLTCMMEAALGQERGSMKPQPLLCEALWEQLCEEHLPHETERPVWGVYQVWWHTQAASRKREIVSFINPLQNKLV